MRPALRAPSNPALHGVVRQLWLSRGRGATGLERVVPTGGAHLAWRLGADIVLGEQVEANGVIGGPRSTAHLHDTTSAWSVGAMLAPGAVPRLFGVSARAVSERHVGLADLWGTGAVELQERLLADPDRALDALEAHLARVLRPDRTPAGLPLVLAALERGLSVEAAARRIGRTPRTLGLWFHDAVGLSASRWSVVRRVRRAMELGAAEADGASLAAAAGYADHAHLCRDFRAVTGLTLTSWRLGHVPGQPSHVPLPIDPSRGRPATVR